MPKIDASSVPARKGSGYFRLSLTIRCTLCCAYAEALGRRGWAIAIATAQRVWESHTLFFEIAACDCTCEYRGKGLDR
jgi:hypothetical protein